MLWPFCARRRTRAGRDAGRAGFRGGFPQGSTAWGGDIRGNAFGVCRCRLFGGSDALLKRLGGSPLLARRVSSYPASSRVPVGGRAMPEAGRARRHDRALEYMVVPAGFSRISITSRSMRLPDGICPAGGRYPRRMGLCPGLSSCEIGQHSSGNFPCCA